MAKPSRRFSRMVKIHCTNLRDVVLAGMARKLYIPKYFISS
jgi:hypothetical protein